VAIADLTQKKFSLMDSKAQLCESKKPNLNPVGIHAAESGGEKKSLLISIFHGILPTYFKYTTKIHLSLIHLSLLKYIYLSLLTDNTTIIFY